MVLIDCLDIHEDDMDLLYLTDSEATLQIIYKWVDCGEKVNLSKSPDTDVLKKIIIKVQKRVQTGTTTLLVKVKDNRGDSLNEEVDIRSEIGRLPSDKGGPINDMDQHG